MGVFGGLLALLLGFLYITAGPNIVKYGDYDPPRNSAAIEAAEDGTAGILAAAVAAAGALCILGGALGFAGCALAHKKPKAAGMLMVAGGVLAAPTVIGAGVTAALAAAGMREFDLASAPIGEPDWQDMESLPY
jgi:hypothetical protein